MTTAHQDLTLTQYIAYALEDNEVTLLKNGALLATTGSRTGRSTQDRFIVCNADTQHTIAWNDMNKPFDEAHYQPLHDKILQYIETKKHYVHHYHVGDHALHYQPVRLVTTTAWHQVFAQHLFINPKVHNPSQKQPWTMLHAPDLQLSPQTDHCHSEAIVLLNMSTQTILIAGTAYAGEIKKAMFSVLNYLLPQQDILPMHCAANQGENGETALFFGLSGTGKTTLSADPNRLLIGDDEHGWSAKGIFNFEGGCYAKCINLNPNHEPVIYQAIRDQAVLENVVLDANQQPDYDDGSLTKNTRAAYDRSHIKKRVLNNQGKNPNAVIFLTCDLFGVLPPVALLTPMQAAYYFLSGYTAKVGSTEMGSAAEIQPTFSHCFGAPFFPRHAHRYAQLLLKRLEQTQAQVYLVNTGWTGGPQGQGGVRFAIPTTRRVVDAIVNQQLIGQETVTYPIFDIQIPQHIAGVDPVLLNPAQCWKDPAAFSMTCHKLAGMFQANFKQFNALDNIDVIAAAGPKLHTEDTVTA